MALPNEPSSVSAPRDVTLPTRPDPGGSAFAIRTRELTREFGGELAVDRVTFDVPEGAIFGFIGPSGSGKTTTIRMLTGVYAPTSGEVTVLGMPPTQFGQAMREQIGYMPQHFVLYPNLSVQENLSFVASIYGMKLRRRQVMTETLQFVELDEHRHKLARNISGGMQRRLALAATLIHDPRLIFLDEPTAGIDPVLRAKFWDHFRSLRERQRTLFITTQYVGEAAFCDLVGVMNESRLVMVDTPEGLRKRAYGGDMVDLHTVERLDYLTERKLRELELVNNRLTRLSENNVRVVVDEASSAIPALLEWCRDQDIAVEGVEEYTPPFDDVFVELVRHSPARSGETA